MFGHIPFFDKTRLQSRNLGIVDLSLAVLLGFWVDRLLADRGEESAIAGWRRWVAAAPALAAAVLCLVASPSRPGSSRRSTGSGVTPTSGRDLTPWFVAQLVVAGAVAALVLGWHRLAPAPRAPARWWPWSSSTSSCSPPHRLDRARRAAPGLSRRPPRPRRCSATGGRFAIYDTTAANVDT